MGPKYSIKLAVVVVGALALASVSAQAQDIIRSEVSFEGTGFFANNSSGNGVVDRATNTGGLLVGYRYNFNRWFAVEGNYGYDRNTQMYFGNTLARVQSDIHQFTGSAVVKLPGLGRFRPYALAGGGALLFEPTGNPGGIFAGANQQTRGTFLYGLGADYVLARHWSLRAEYRGLVYKAPDFNFAGLNTDGWTNISQPSAGIVFRF